MTNATAATTAAAIACACAAAWSQAAETELYVAETELYVAEMAVRDALLELKRAELLRRSTAVTLAYSMGCLGDNGVAQVVTAVEAYLNA